EAARQSLMLAGIVSAILGVPLFFLRRHVLSLMGASPAVVQEGHVYLALVLAVNVPYFLLLTLIAIFQGLGDLRRPLAIMLVVNGIDIGGDLVLVRGWGPIPALGVTGAGISTSVARLAAAAVGAPCRARTCRR